MRHLFTYGSVSFSVAADIDVQEAEGNRFPAHWRLVRFDEFATLQRGGDLPKASFLDGDIPVIGATKVIGYHNVANAKGPGVTVVRSGSSVGKPLYVPVDFWAHNVVLYVKNAHGNNMKFAYYKMLEFDLSRYRGGVAVPTLNRNSFKNALLAVPPSKEQDSIVSMLDALERKISSMEARRKSLGDIFNSLLADLMTGRIRTPQPWPAVGPSARIHQPSADPSP